MGIGLRFGGLNWVANTARGRVKSDFVRKSLIYNNLHLRLCFA